ncbi:TPA: hypothetical protein HA278_00465 [Candidatus Woesearchaeota archaeon]|nr:hypothetical protein [archaeon]HIJ10502.1 hypothetical protein [Candidatus Woesearchaeota archaeon]
MANTDGTSKGGKIFIIVLIVLFLLGALVYGFFTGGSETDISEITGIFFDKNGDFSFTTLINTALIAVLLIVISWIIRVSSDKNKDKWEKITTSTSFYVVLFVIALFFAVQLGDQEIWSSETFTDGTQLLWGDAKLKGAYTSDGETLYGVLRPKVNYPEGTTQLPLVTLLISGIFLILLFKYGKDQWKLPFPPFLLNILAVLIAISVANAGTPLSTIFWIVYIVLLYVLYRVFTGGENGSETFEDKELGLTFAIFLMELVAEFVKSFTGGNPPIYSIPVTWWAMLLKFIFIYLLVVFALGPIFGKASGVREMLHLVRDSTGEKIVGGPQRFLKRRRITKLEELFRNNEEEKAVADALKTGLGGRIKELAKKAEPGTTMTLFAAAIKAKELESETDEEGKANEKILRALEFDRKRNEAEQKVRLEKEIREQKIAAQRQIRQRIESNELEVQVEGEPPQPEGDTA